MISNYRLRFGWVKTTGTKRVHWYRYKSEEQTGYELGVNIVPRRFGVLVYMWIVNTKAELENKLRQKEEYIESLKDIIRMLSRRG